MDQELKKKLKACRTDDEIYELGFRCVGRVPSLVISRRDLTEHEFKVVFGQKFKNCWVWKRNRTWIMIDENKNEIKEVACSFVGDLRALVRDIVGR